MNNEEIEYLVYLIQSQKYDQNFFSSIYINEEKLRFILPVLEMIKEKTHLYNEYKYVSTIENYCKFCLNEILKNFS